MWWISHHTYWHTQRCWQEGWLCDEYHILHTDTALLTGRLIMWWISHPAYWHTQRYWQQGWLCDEYHIPHTYTVSVVDRKVGYVINSTSLVLTHSALLTRRLVMWWILHPVYWHSRRCWQEGWLCDEYHILHTDTLSVVDRKVDYVMNITSYILHVSFFSHRHVKGFSSQRIDVLQADVLQDRKIYCLLTRPCIFQPGHFTGWGSEGVNNYVCSMQQHYTYCDGCQGENYPLVSSPSLARLMMLVLNEACRWSSTVIKQNLTPLVMLMGALFTWCCFWNRDPCPQTAYAHTYTPCIAFRHLPPNPASIQTQTGSKERLFILPRTYCMCLER